MARITLALQHTVRDNPKILNVYFNKKGEHFFNKHVVEVHTDDGKGNSSKMEKVDSLPGVSSGILNVKVGAKVVAKRVHTGYSPIAESMTREEVLAAKAVVDATMTEKDEDAIIRHAQEILKRRAGLLAVVSAATSEISEFDEEAYKEHKEGFETMNDDSILDFAKKLKKNPKKYSEEEAKAITDIVAERKLDVK